MDYNIKMDSSKKKKKREKITITEWMDRLCIFASQKFHRAFGAEWQNEKYDKHGWPAVRWKLDGSGAGKKLQEQYQNIKNCKVHRNSTWQMQMYWFWKFPTTKLRPMFRRGKKILLAICR